MTDAPDRECEAPACSARFAPQRSTARYCSSTCRQRAARERKSVARSDELAQTAAEETKPGGDVEHDLVASVRSELEQAGKVLTFNGQLALQLARKLVNPEESGATSLSKELRTVMNAALAPDPDAAPSAPAEDESDDEVKAARRRREEIAAAAAAQATT